MSAFFIVSHIGLFVCALLLAGRSYQIAEQKNLTAFMVISLSAAFIAASAAGNLLLIESNQDIATLKRLLDNLAFYAAIPLIASALLDFSRNYDWSRAAWGRWLLALFALFELCRRADIGILYSQIMSVVSVSVILLSALKLANRNAQLSGLISAISLGVALLIYSPASLLPEMISPIHFALLEAFSLASLSLAITTKQVKNS